MNIKQVNIIMKEVNGKLYPTAYGLGDDNNMYMWHNQKAAWVMDQYVPRDQNQH